MNGIIVPLAGSVNTVSSAVTTEVAAAAPVAAALIGTLAAAAFGIKALYVAWRAGSKAMGKVGS